METSPFSGQVAVITGAAGGIGAALAETFADRGATCAGIDLAAPEAMPPDSRSYACDVGDGAAIASCVERIRSELGRIDILVNCAGIGVLGPAESYTSADWDKTMAINLRAPWEMAKACFPALVESGRGRILNISSQAALIGIPEHSAYAASKAGLLGMTRTMAVEWARHGITVNCISPTVVETPLALVGWAGEKGERARAEIPAGRFARPAEIAAAAAYLASGEAAMITGENLVIDGGYTVR